VVILGREAKEMLIDARRRLKKPEAYSIRPTHPKRAVRLSSRRSQDALLPEGIR
jgi:hypothetical protein